MDHAALRHQMAEVVRTARATLRDPAQAARLWGRTTELCDDLERDSAHAPQRVSMIVAVREDVRTGARSTRELVDEIVWFVRAVEHDIEDEEREAIVDEVVTPDQMDG